MRNAFGSGDMETLNDMLTRRALSNCPPQEEESTEALLRQRRFDARVCVPTDSGPLVMRLGSGGTMGDANEPEAFMSNFYTTITPWILKSNRTYGKAFMYASPVTGATVDGSWGAFVDDLIRLLPFLDGTAGLALFQWDNEILDDVLVCASYAQNNDKQETIVSWNERNARKRLMASIASTSRALPALKHLGAFIEPGGTNAPEIQERVRATNVAWLNMGRFWTTRAPYRVKRLVFLGLIYSTAISGLEAMVLNKGEMATITKTLTKKLRCMTMGRLTKEVAGVRRAPSELDLWKYWRLLPPCQELVVRRLRWYQAIAREPEQNEQWLAVMFGLPKVCIDADIPNTLNDDGEVEKSPDTNPWAVRLAEDLET